MRNGARVAVVALVALVGLAACGGDDDDDLVAASTSGAAGPDATTPATAPPVTGDEEALDPVPPAAGCTGDRSVEVMTCTGLTNLHVVEAPDYEVIPPLGGDHNQVWANCGYYAGPVPPEFAVHSLEHGAVWIAYAGDTGDADSDLLRSLVQVDARLLVSELDDAPAPFVLTAWGAQRYVQALDDPAVVEFIDEYQDGAGAPEPGNLCTQGLGVPDVAPAQPT